QSNGFAQSELLCQPLCFDHRTEKQPLLKQNTTTVARRVSKSESAVAKGYGGQVFMRLRQKS
ncbi:MAG: hypothetical protein KKE31_07900, partial [Planctomycetes bacterium]|nr:hypothetical protein [Planctomycetota bacterium]